jgi:hypothetical protein
MMARVIYVFAFLILAGFIGVLVVEVPRLDLGLVAAITLLMVVYDFFHTPKTDDR